VITEKLVRTLTHDMSFDMAGLVRKNIANDQAIFWLDLHALHVAGNDSHVRIHSLPEMALDKPQKGYQCPSHNANFNALIAKPETPLNTNEASVSGLLSSQIVISCPPLRGWTMVT
jgi:hypothetical protein